jgi:transposase
MDKSVVPFGEEMLKPDFYQLIKRNKPVDRTYKADSILAEHSHTVLRLPPYYPELIPIELIWATVKNWIAEKNVTFKSSNSLMKLCCHYE